LIGHNNSGKSNVVQALSLLFNPKKKKQLEIHDFSKDIQLSDLQERPPKITITATISQSKDEEIFSDDLVTVSHWLVKLSKPYEARLTYEYFLPFSEHENYKRLVSTATSRKEVWRIIQDEFIRKYVYKIWGGNPDNQLAANFETLQNFDFQFLDAIRDVERDMYSGKNTLLRDVLEFFIDYDIKSNEGLDDKAKEQKIKNRKQLFVSDADNLILKLQDRMEEGKEKILSYASEIGASFDHSSPNFDGNLSEFELYSALKLIVEYSKDIKIPVSHNGLGYNNLIFMSLLLAKMQINTDGNYLGSNAKVFPILTIEEPEAHLHPTMQRQFLDFIHKNKENNKVRQIFITTHSTHIVSSTSLDNIICLYKKENKSHVAYPGKVFTEEKSKKYVERFLDATKSDMLFSEKIILVEGIAEQLLMSVFSKYLNKSLEEHHVTVINIGGRYFDHFLRLFDSKDKNAINRKVACLTDIDPLQKKIGKNGKFEKCYPFEYNVDREQFEYIKNINLNDYLDGRHPNISAFTQDEKYGKTFEYDLVFANPSLEILVTDSMSNKEELKDLMKAYKNKKSLKDLLDILSNKGDENNRIRNAIQMVHESWSEDDQKRALIASRYLNSISKGENALELAYSLQENLDKKKDNQKEMNFQELNVPVYIKEAIEWVCS
jgi:predicted ATP-dependent endonuclease of OLD family